MLRCVFPHPVSLRLGLFFQHGGLSSSWTILLLLFANSFFLPLLLFQCTCQSHVLSLRFTHHPKPLPPLCFPACSKAFGVPSWPSLFSKIDCRNHLSSSTNLHSLFSISKSFLYNHYQQSILIEVRQDVATWGPVRPKPSCLPGPWRHLSLWPNNKNQWKKINQRKPVPFYDQERESLKTHKRK